MIPNYPDICPQTLIEPWWEENLDDDFRPGRLVWAFLPHVDQEPYILEPIGRENPTEHDTGIVQIKKYRIGEVRKKDHPPVAAMPLHDKEIFHVYRAKRRPAIIISKGGGYIEKELTSNLPKWRTNPTILLAPSYSVDGGYKEIFCERVRRCEYPQFFWDNLPVGGTERGSIIRFDHLQPVGKSKKSIELTNHCLSDKALVYIMQWLDWLLSGQLDEESLFCETRSFLMEI